VKTKNDCVTFDASFSTNGARLDADMLIEHIRNIRVPWYLSAFLRHLLKLVCGYGTYQFILQGREEIFVVFIDSLNGRQIHTFPTDGFEVVDGEVQVKVLR